MKTTSGAAKNGSEEFLEASRVFLKDDYLPKLLHCVEGLSDDDIWWRPNEASNSVGNLILHLCGNVRQWIVAALGGADFKRDRDGEFASRGAVPKSELIASIRKAIDDVDDVLGRFASSRLMQRYPIQKYDTTALQAIYHVVEHFSYHLGQILYIYKMRTGADPGWYRDLSNR